MISFKTRDDVVPSVLIIISIVAVAGVLIYYLCFPVADPASIAFNSRNQIRLLDASIDQANAQAAAARSQVSHRMWKGDANHVGGAILALITNRCNDNGVKLNAFRPQRTIALEGTTELPYSVELAGPFPGVRAVMRSLDNSHSKVTLESVQIAASEEVTGAVTSTIVIAAFVPAASAPSDSDEQESADAQTN